MTDGRRYRHRVDASISLRFGEPRAGHAFLLIGYDETGFLDSKFLEHDLGKIGDLLISRTATGTPTAWTLGSHSWGCVKANTLKDSLLDWI